MAEKRPPRDMLDWMGLRETPDWMRARWLGAGFAVALGLLFVLALTAAVVTLLAVFRGEASLGAGALIVALLSAPFLVWNTVIRHRALGFQKEGHLTDRLAKAVEQLGAEKTVKTVVLGEDGQPVLDKDGKAMSRETTEPNLEVRIGGLLSLERIAQDSAAYDKGRDHVRVMEIICAYVRNNAPASGAAVYGDPLEDLEPQADADAVAAYLARIKEWKEGHSAWLETLKPPREDIMLALEIISRRSLRQRRIEAAYGQEGVEEAEWVFGMEYNAWSYDPALPPPTRDDVESAKQRNTELIGKIRSYSGYRPSLRRVDLRHGLFDELDLRGVIFEGAVLDGATFHKCNFSNAEMTECQIHNCLFNGCQMSGADISAAKMIGGQFYGSTFTITTFSEARIIGVQFVTCWLDGAKFMWSDLKVVNFEGGRSYGALYCGASLRYCQLYSCGLVFCDHWDSDFSGSEFSYLRIIYQEVPTSLDLTHSSFRNVEFLCEPDFSDVLSYTFGDATVRVSCDLPPHWPTWELDDVDYGFELAKFRANPSAYTPPPPPT